MEICILREYVFLPVDGKTSWNHKVCKSFKSSINLKVLLLSELIKLVFLIKMTLSNPASSIIIIASHAVRHTILQHSVSMPPWPPLLQHACLPSLYASTVLLQFVHGFHDALLSVAYADIID